MSTTTDQLGKQAMEVTKDLREMGNIVRDAAQEKVGEVRENASELYAQGRDNVHDLACAVEQFLRERPFQSVLIAAGIGWLLGRLGKRG
jgi:ElaB/YqjD/DUF883 family membrane-anchored ribosome-binding protein